MEFNVLIDPATLDFIDQAMRDAAATGRELGQAFDLQFERDTTEGEPATFTVTNVAVSFAAREPARVSGNAATYMGADGQLEHEVPFPVQKGDRFRLPADAPNTRGAAGFITMVLPADNGWVIALFTLQG
jgi:hypothetical protein